MFADARVKRVRWYILLRDIDLMFVDLMFSMGAYAPSFFTFVGQR